MDSYLLTTITTLAVFFGSACGAYVVVGVAIDHWSVAKLREAERALTREIAAHEGHRNLARDHIGKLESANGRLRNRCVRLLEITDMERSARIETQIEAREREKQIREEMRNSTFGAFTS